MLPFRQNEASRRPVPSILWALAALAILLLWQFLTIHYNRGGNWTALFLTGADWPIPPQLAAGTYSFPGRGFDGQMYRYVAHDPFMQLGYAHYMDGPAQRYHRILIPALAYLLAAGYQPWIDASYIAVVALFVFLGAYWLSRWAVLVGAHPAWALAFLLIPATIISMDRMTIDVGVAAFTIAFALYWTSGAWAKLFVVLLLACLARESGLLLIAGACLFELFHRRFARVLLWAAASLPMLAWYFVVRQRFFEKTRYGVPSWFARHPGPGIFYRILIPPHYPLSPLLDTIARSADVLALLGILLASILAILLLVRARSHGPLGISAFLFVILVFAMMWGPYWTDVNGYARVFSPLVILVALPSMTKETSSARPWWLGLIPAVVIDLRLGMQFTSAIEGVLRGLLKQI